MTDKDLIETAASFREGLLDGEPSEMMCAAVSWPLASFLRAICKLDCDTEESEVPFRGRTINHVWIRLKDGRVLDPTADQFGDYPPVYLGPPNALHLTKVNA